MADTIELIYIKTGPGRTLAYEVGDKAGVKTDEVWQEVEAGDLDGYWDMGFDEPIECDCGREFEDGEDTCPDCGKALADFVHPHCEECSATIYTMQGDWCDPWGDYHCFRCVEVVSTDENEEDASEAETSEE